jgi:uncharacterized membrane protein YcaP (DUF421 family)
MESTSIYLIQRGEIVQDSLLKIRKTEPWVRERLQDLQIYDIRQVRYAHLDRYGNLHVHISD